MRLIFLHSGAILRLNTAVTPLSNAQPWRLFFVLEGRTVLENYTKPPLTFDQQLQQLNDRGLLVDDDELALIHLRTISYYRLSAYWYPFRKIEQDGVISDNFEVGTNFKEVIGLYEFDRQLRLQVMDAIERIEVYVRTLVTETIGHNYGPFGHTVAANFHQGFNHDSWLMKCESEAERSSDAFVVHYKDKYCGFPTLPIWMVTELMSLGSLSHVYRGLKNEDKGIISTAFELHFKILVNWLRALTYIRNICSHHGRLWNRKLAIRPRHTSGINWETPVRLDNERIFCVLLILRYLLRNVPVRDKWKKQMDNLLEPVAQNEKLRVAMGMPGDWMNHRIWR